MECISSGVGIHEKREQDESKTTEESSQEVSEKQCLIKSRSSKLRLISRSKYKQQEHYIEIS